MAGKKQLAPVRLLHEYDDSTEDSVARAFETGSRLAELKAMYLRLAAHIDNDNTLARDLAPLMRQAREISKEIEEMQQADASDDVSDAAATPDESW